MSIVRRRTLRTVFTTLLVTLLAGCTLLSPAKLEYHKESLSKIPSNLPRHETHSATLLVLVPETEPIYNTTQMVYTERPYEIAYFSRHEWVATPSQMFHPLIIKTLQNGRYFSAVLAPPYLGSHTYVLRTDIIELKQDYTITPPQLSLALRFSLSSAQTNQIIDTKNIDIQKPMQHRTPYAGVVAANDATAEALRDMVEFVINKIH